ncbi:glycosyltransferase involved in cell wall biosynthesis [Caldicoprobacter guelmensis]|nr:hypothetical protein [Caldicoprobacter guelmensis]MBM7581420.1 glycosyltransferase involved in cell wall biosynthesis [Caldicoprobacter guelmensis]
MSVAVIIPAYNEERHVSQVLTAAKKVDEVDDIVVWRVRNALREGESYGR